MDGMTTYDAIADAFGFGEIKNYDWFTLGKVTAVDGTKLKVLLGGSSVPADCESYCGAQVGDVVLVVIMKGIARAVAVKGGGAYLPLAGGTITGELEITRPSDGSGRIYLGDNTTGQRNGIIVYGGGTREGWAFSTISGSDSNGDAVLMGDGGMVVVGSGESAKGLYDELVSGEAPEGTFAPETEQTFIASDNDVYIVPNCNTIGNRQRWIFASNGHLVDKKYDLDISSATNGLSSNIDNVIGCRDKNDRWANYIDFWDKTDGSCNTIITARKYINGANVNNNVQMTVDKNGNCTTTFSNPAAWCKALGLTYNSGYSSYFTPASGITVNWFGISTWGKVVCVVMSWKSSSAISVPADGNITDKDIGTFASSIRPPMEIHGVSSGDPQCWYWFATNGVLKVGAFEGNGAARTIAANTNVDFYATWVLTS